MPALGLLDSPREWLLALAGLIIGLLIKTLGDHLDYRRAHKRRFDRDRLEAYIEFCAVLDDYRDCVVAEQNSPTSSTSLGEVRERLDSRANLALARIDLLAPAKVSTVATDAWQVADLPLEDPERVQHMESLMTEMRRDLGVKPPEWKQHTGSYTPPMATSPAKSSPSPS